MAGLSDERSSRLVVLPQGSDATIPGPGRLGSADSFAATVRNSSSTSPSRIRSDALFFGRELDQETAARLARRQAIQLLLHGIDRGL